MPSKKSSVCNAREQIKVQKNAKLASGQKGVELQPLEPPKCNHNVRNVLNFYANATEHQKPLKRQQKSKSALKVNEILHLTETSLEHEGRLQSW